MSGQEWAVPGGHGAVDDASSADFGEYPRTNANSMV